MNTRTVLIYASLIDAALGAAILLIYFGLLPINISGWDIPRWVVGLVGGVWFLAAVAVFAYQITRTDAPE